jgi:hypothetical protein
MGNRASQQKVMPQPLGFFIAPFSIDGEQEGLVFRDISKLSSKWLSICSDFLNSHGNSFEAAWSGQLSHIKTRFTVASGVALVTFYIADRIAASIVLSDGSSSSTESKVLQMFVDSILKIKLVQEAATSPTVFHKMLSIKERPLMVVIPWPDADITATDHDLVRELTQHLAGAFFTRQFNPERFVH